MLTCPTCGATDQVSVFGILGKLVHFRCQMCGMDASIPYKELEQASMDEGDIASIREGNE